MEQGSVIHIHDENKYNNTLLIKDKIVVVNFGAKWCAPCKKYGPKYEELAKQYPNIIFLYVDIDQLEKLGDCANVQKVPSFKFFENEILIQFVEGLNEPKIIETINKLSSSFL